MERNQLYGQYHSRLTDLGMFKSANKQCGGFSIANKRPDERLHGVSNMDTYRVWFDYSRNGHVFYSGRLLLAYWEPCFCKRDSDLDGAHGDGKYEDLLAIIGEESFKL